MSNHPTNLFIKAMVDVEELGYEFRIVPRWQIEGHRMVGLCKDGQDSLALIHTRSHTSWSCYQMAINMFALMKSDLFIPWFEHEKVTFIIPANWVLDVWENHKKRGLVTYSQADGHHWNVDFYPDKQILRPRVNKAHPALFSKDYNIQQYAVSAPQKWIKVVSMREKGFVECKTCKSWIKIEQQNNCPGCTDSFKNLRSSFVPPSKAKKNHPPQPEENGLAVRVKSMIEQLNYPFETEGLIVICYSNHLTGYILIALDGQDLNKVSEALSLGNRRRRYFFVRFQWQDLNSSIYNNKQFIKEKDPILKRKKQKKFFSNLKNHSVTMRLLHSSVEILSVRKKGDYKMNDRNIINIIQDRDNVGKQGPVTFYAPPKLGTIKRRSAKG